MAVLPRVVMGRRLNVYSHAVELSTHSSLDADETGDFARSVFVDARSLCRRTRGVCYLVLRDELEAFVTRFWDFKPERTDACPRCVALFAKRPPTPKEDA